MIALTLAFKSHLHEIFWYRVIRPNEPIKAPDEHPKIVLSLVSNSPRHLTFCAFCIFSVYIQILSAYSQYTNRIILLICTDSFRIFGECAHIILNIQIELFSLQLSKGYYFEKSICVCNWAKDLQGIINYLALAWQNNIFPRILIVRYHSEGPMKLNACNLLLAHMVYL